MNAPLANSTLQLHQHMERLRQALHDGNEQMETDAVRTISQSIAKDSSVSPYLVETLRIEPDAGVLLIVGKTILRSGAAKDRELITTAALNLLLSDDTVARRKASLEILANSTSLTADLFRAVARVAREDASAEIKQAAIVVIEAWMDRHPDLGVELRRELAATPTNESRNDLPLGRKRNL